MKQLITSRALAAASSDLAVAPVGIDSLDSLVAKIISVVGVVAGVAAFIFLLYSGFLYLTSGGNSEQTKKATQGIVSAIIGMIVIILAYVIVTAVKDVVK
ncbi:MAG: hypothetical protein WCT32_05675 [Patescibacteria group bacterium]